MLYPLDKKIPPTPTLPDIEYHRALENRIYPKETKFIPAVPKISTDLIVDDPVTETYFPTNSVLSPPKRDLSFCTEAITQLGPMKTTKKLDEWGRKNLPNRIQLALQENGKHNPNLKFRGQITMRHLIPYLSKTKLLDSEVWYKLYEAGAGYVIELYESLEEEYANIDTSSVRGFKPYKNALSETELNEERTRLSSAALFQYDFIVEDFVRYLGGPHTASHRNPTAIRACLLKSVERQTLNRLIEVFEFGNPRTTDGYNTEENFIKFYLYGNRTSD